MSKHGSHLREACLLLTALLALGGVACTTDAEGHASRPARADVAAADDSARREAELEAALAEFREELPVVTRLEGGETDRDALVRRFVNAVEARDTDDLAAIVMDRAEFAYLYYPTSPYTRRPTRQEAPLAWFLQLQNSQKGISRVLARYGGNALHAAGYACDAEPVVSGANRIWSNCVMRLAPPGADTTAIRLFGGIIEREGRFKLFSYTNDL